MKRSDNRILTTHSGSLIRPPELTELEASSRQGRQPECDAYEAALRNAVADIVQAQVGAGIDVVDDGEYSKSSWGTYINQRVSGFKHDPERDMAINYTGKDSERFSAFFDAEAPNSARRRWRGADVCVEPIAYVDTHSIKRDIENLKAALETAGVEEAFLPVVAPASAAFNGVNEYYKTDEEYVYALADALRNEYQAIYESGLLVQVDDAVLANAYDDLMAKGPEVYRKWANTRIEALNHALRGIPEDRIRYHLCYGSWHAPHVSDAPLEDIVDLILRVNAGAYSIEAANVRHEHEWRVWENAKLPEGKVLIPGVVTHHTITVEHPQLVADRIIRYANIVGRENVIAGTDCGFQQGARIERVHPTVMWAKLRSLAEGAQIAGKELWELIEELENQEGITMTTESIRGSKAGVTVRQPDPPAAGELQQTPREIEGPYFRLGAPERSNLLEPGDKPELVLTGRVLNEKGTPILGAVVNLWSSDAAGNYDMVGYRYHGYQVCDAEGRYEFTTIIPGCYEPRDAKHLHVKVQGNSSPVTTQLYIGGEPGNEDDDYYSSDLLVQCTTGTDGVKHGTYDFVVKQVTERENVTPESLAARV